ncbi:pilin assembly protein [Pseudomonas sp.]|uniref:pilin assembly protein n=1 Tax=Pseudomonas sp. TaxID=306 RepID=UPI003D11E9F6
MRISELVSRWERDAKGRMSQTRYTIPLDIESAARLAALAEMYPKRSTEALLGELVGAALEAVETSLPYVRGTQVIATDEQGDPIYEDVGPTPRFLELSRQHLQRMLDEQKAPTSA